MFDNHWQQAVIGLVTMDSEGNMIRMNKAFTDLVGYDQEELLWHHFEKVMNNGSKFFFHSMVYPKIRIENVVKEVYLYLQTKTGESLTVMFNANSIQEGDKELIDCFIVQDTQRRGHLKEIQDINTSLEEALKEKTELHEALISANEELRRFAETDFLTGLYNRRIAIKQLEQLYASAQLEQTLFSVGLIDIDHFKNVNDSYGHNIGDAVLQGLAEEMQTFFDPSVISGRFGGEEFIVLLPKSDREDALDLMNAFREHIAARTWHEVSITLSIGVDTVREPSDISDILIRADHALYEAKRRGRNQVVVLEES